MQPQFFLQESTMSKELLHYFPVGYETRKQCSFFLYLSETGY